MKISARNFIASQALHGLMISRKSMPYKKMVDKSYEIAGMMIKEGKKYEKKNPTSNTHVH